MEISYTASRPISSEQFIDLLRRSTLAERRPVDDPAAIAAMLKHADVLCTAWDGETLVGVARSLTDFNFCCYLSDLAVDERYQKRGIGRELIACTRTQLQPKAKIILLAAPQAEAYYPRIGFDHMRSAWMLPGDKQLK